MEEFRPKNYKWAVYGDGGPTNPQCKMVGYFVEPTQTPQEWQEVLHGDAERLGRTIIARDRELDEEAGHYKQTTINEEERWYARKSYRSGNTWEVVLNEDGSVQPDPCPREPEPEPDPKNPEPVHLSDAIITFVRSGNNVTVTISGTELT
jgi:hypothetical protein